MKFLKIISIIFGALLMVFGLLLWNMALHRKYEANRENWDGKLHFQTAIICSAPLIAGFIILVIGTNIKKKSQI